MNMYDLIVRKKRGGELTEEEIAWMIDGFTKDKIPDYQMSAMLMAICFVGMTHEETKHLTMSMTNSGRILDLSGIHGIKVDKHSTGGVGDKTSLVVGPLVASLGVPVAKMSGRGLGHTGGTIDKLESFRGFRTGLRIEEFISQVNDIKIAIAGQTENLALADKKLYALRDVTGTVEQTSLIASSIMSKKLASGADAIVLDVKTGNGAFMKTQSDAIALAQEMVSIGKLSGKEVDAIVSDMDQPLGYAVGNALEVKEAIDTLQGNGPEDLEELALTLGAQMVFRAKQTETAADARRKLKESIKNGKAFDKFLQWIKIQGGDIRQAKDPALLPTASIQKEVFASEDGYVKTIDTEEIGRISLLLGGGRETKESRIDHAVGLVLQKKKCDPIVKGETIAVIHANDMKKAEEAALRLERAYHISVECPKAEPLIKKVLES